MRELKNIVKTMMMPSRQRYPLTLETKKSIGRSPFFIVGSGRSGNTLLRRLLSDSKSIYIPPETYQLGPSIITFKKYSDLDWGILCKIILANFMLSEDFETFPTPYLRTLYLDLINTPPNTRSASLMISKFYMYMARHAKPSATFWGDKTPLNSFYLGCIDSVFPNARYVHIVRDGYDVVASYLAMGRYRTAAEAAHRWVDSVQNCEKFRKVHPQSCIRVFYEELVTEPMSTMREIFEFLNVELPEDLNFNAGFGDTLGDVDKRPHYASVLQPISTKNIGKGYMSLTREQLCQVKDIIEPLRLSLGYKVVK